MYKLLPFLICFVWVACGPTQQINVSDALTGTWELDYITGRRIAFKGLYPEKVPFITFNQSSGEISGNSSCNGFSAKYKIKGNAITFHEPLKTMMFCEGGGEEAFFDSLEKITHYRVKNDTLYLTFNNIDAMRFHKK
jgi:heat shock protein HslJ